MIKGIAVIAVAGMASAAVADDISFGFRSDTNAIVGGEITLPEGFTGTIGLYLTGTMTDDGQGDSPFSLGGFGGAISTDDGSSSLAMRGGNWREFEGIDLDIPTTKMGMVHPFRDLFGPADAPPGSNDNGTADNQFASLVGFDLATNGVGDLDGAVGTGSNDDLYKFEIEITDGTARMFFVNFETNEGVDNVNQIIYETSSGGFRYEVVDGGDARLKITIVPAPGALALLGLGGFAAARRRRA